MIMGEFEVWAYLVTHRGTFLMEMGLFNDYFGIFSMHGEKYYFLCGEEHVRYDWTHLR